MLYACCTHLRQARTAEPVAAVDFDAGITATKRPVEGVEPTSPGECDPQATTEGVDDCRRDAIPEQGIGIQIKVGVGRIPDNPVYGCLQNASGFRGSEMSVQT